MGSFFLNIKISCPNVGTGLVDLQKKKLAWGEQCKGRQVEIDCGGSPSLYSSHVIIHTGTGNRPGVPVIHPPQRSFVFVVQFYAIILPYCTLSSLFILYCTLYLYCTMYNQGQMRQYMEAQVSGSREPLAIPNPKALKSSVYIASRIPMDDDLKN